MSEVRNQKSDKLKDNDPMGQLLAKHKQEIRVFRPGELVEGTVISLAHNRLLLDIGGKSEGVIIGRELEDTEKTVKKLKVGDTLLAKVIQSENDNGYTVLSLRRAEKDRHWRDFQKHLTEGTILSCRVTEYNKGGLVVDVLGVPGFIPLSRLDPAHEASSLVGQTLAATVIEVSEANNRLVLSEKEADEVGGEARTKRLEEIHAGEVIAGKVSGVTAFGVFVDLQGVEGLAHISELAWDKVLMPAKLYKVGDEVSVKVLSVDTATGKVALSIKQLSNDPWAEVDKKYPEGRLVTGTVSKIAPFGAFVNLEPGVDGLIHVSETVGPLKEGEEVEALVVNVDAKNRKLGLSVRKLQGGKWNKS
jgi:small subunit ribosomal protein S1